MTTVILGQGAYERLYAKEPIIRLENRFVEANPTNLKEQSALLTRPGTAVLRNFGGGKYRRAFTEPGMFNGDLFVINGKTLFRWSGSGTPTVIVGEIKGEGAPSITWVKGAGYQRLFIADGLLLQYYDGGTHAAGLMTLTGTITASNEVVQIGTAYYTFNDAVNAGTPDGSAAFPWRVRLSGDPLQNFEDTIMFNGTPGFTFSSAIAGANPVVTARAIGGPPATQMQFEAISEGTDGNAIATVVTGTSPKLSFASATLTGGGVHVLHGIAMPDGVGAKAVCSLKGYCLVAVAASQQFYWVEPGEVVIDPLNFANKESSPDNIQDIVRVGDNALIVGESSTESWYATGVIDSPFAPVSGRVYNRGAIDGTVTVVKDSVILVGNDGIVYQIGYSSGGSADYGVNRISNHGIEERIRRQVRREKGLTP